MDDEEKEEIIKFSPGFYEGHSASGGVVFEQIEDSKFADSISPDVPLPKFAVNGISYAPLPRCPWFLAPKPIKYVDFKMLYNDVRKFVYDHVFMPEEALYDVATAWTISTWIHEIWPVVPYFFFYGPVASGKTRGLETLQRVSYRGILASNISAAALFRSLQEWHPTLFLDETEIYNKDQKIEVIGLLNSGYRRGQYAIRAKSTERGVELEVFDTFGFKALAGTRGLARALESRSIMVRMIKSRRKIKKLIDEQQATELRGKLLKFRFDVLSKKKGDGVVCELSELFELFIGDIPPLKLQDGRLEELFTCLLAVSNEGRVNIMKYAEKLEQLRLFEEKASDEAEIIEILAKTDLINEKGVVLTKDVAEEFNRTRPEREKYKTNSIGWLIRELGFDKIHTGQGNGWLINKERLRYWQEIYCVDITDTPPPPEKVQNIQNVHDSPLYQPERPQSIPTDGPTCNTCLSFQRASCIHPNPHGIVPSAVYPAHCKGYMPKEEEKE